MKSKVQANHLNEQILLEHGTGGLMSRELIESVMVPILGDRYIGRMEDSAILKLPANNIAMTTDSFVVDPYIFLNGDIGKLAICGTVNDLAVSGAKPLYLTLGLIIETGFAINNLRRILTSLAQAAKEADIYIVAGDTKVVDKGAADKIFINTTGVGVFERESTVLSARNIVANDEIIITGQIGNHSIHLLSMREGLGFESNVLSDCAPLNHMIKDILETFEGKIHCIRDVTRGGLATVLNEIASDIAKGMSIEMSQVPVQYETKMATELLGLDPMYLANEGCCCIFCSPDIVEELLSTLHNHKYGVHAKRIGRVEASGDIDVVGIHEDGSKKNIDCLVGMQLPRLC